MMLVTNNKCTDGLEVKKERGRETEEQEKTVIDKVEIRKGPRPGF